MSYELMAAALFAENVNPTRKLVLITLANHANDAGASCYPSINRIATITGYSRPTVMDALKWLAENGRVERSCAKGRNTVYQIAPLVKQLYQSNSLTSKAGLPVKQLDHTGKVALPELVKQLDPKQSYKQSYKQSEGETHPRNESGHAQRATRQKRFTPPTLDEVSAYARSRGQQTSMAEAFHDYHTAKGWIIGKSTMRDWQAAFRTWQRNESSRARPQPAGTRNRPQTTASGNTLQEVGE